MLRYGRRFETEHPPEPDLADEPSGGRERCREREPRTTCEPVSRSAVRYGNEIDARTRLPYQAPARGSHESCQSLPRHAAQPPKDVEAEPFFNHLTV